jgi:hypothetical protein
MTATRRAAASRGPTVSTGRAATIATGSTAA